MPMSALCAVASQQLQLRLEKALARARQGPQTDLHRAQRMRSAESFVAFTDTWGDRYPAIIKLWDSAWAKFMPFLQFDNSIRSVVCTTNAIESINARIRRAVNARGHFPTRRRR
jgi:transposase-like protein